ncbi:MAG: Ig-like domain-containing protein, partial [Candidatus Marinimicrobia bacterium]|nr:Ig-like domain-containing protein [Candidatus Neomarinimicrobiota bacterium]
SMNWESVKGAVHVEPDDSGMDLSFSGDRYLTISLDLIMGTEYTVTIDTNACTMGGKPLEFNYSFSFTTEPFRLEYFGSARSRSRGSSGSSKDFCPLEFNFNADVDPDLFMENLTIYPPVVEVSTEGTSYGDRVLLYPLYGWMSGTNMTFTISADFTDINGNHLPGDTTLSVEIDPLQVSRVNPYDKQYFVPLAPVILIYFNNIIDESTIEGALKITPEINPNIVTYQSSEYSMLRVYPDSSLASNMQYTIEIDTSLTDYYGMNLPEKFVSVFTTK